MKNLALLFALLTAASCGRGAEDLLSCPAVAGSLKLLAQPEASTQLSSFRGDLATVTLTRPDGSSELVSFAAPLRLEWVDQGTGPVWFASLSTDGCTAHSELELEFVADSLTAVGIDGTPLAVQASDTTWTIDVGASAGLQVGLFKTWAATLDLAASLSPDGSGGLVFDPAGGVAVASSPTIEVAGTVPVDIATPTVFLVDVFVGPAQHELGTLSLVPTEDTLFFGTGGEPLQDVEAFVEALAQAGSGGLAAFGAAGTLDANHELLLDWIEVRTRAEGGGIAAVTFTYVW